MMHRYLDGKLRCKLCGQRVAAQLMTAVRRPCGKRQYYFPPCDERRWDDSPDVIVRARPPSRGLFLPGTRVGLWRRDELGRFRRRRRKLAA